ncbi:MAG TPA: nucleotidyltransferase domain-containing protein [Patescibacteria group bacterium]|nr:nucleotidyltransferase domain-containing protein [Patescibacteria group bacterium]
MSKINKIIENIIPIFKKYPQIKLAYFFGSRAEKTEGPMSDYDFAVYLDEKDKNKMSEIKFFLADKIGLALQTDKIDIVILNTAESSELKYNIIKDGILIHEKEPYKMIVEPKILNEYFDFYSMLKRHNLTAA